MKQATIFSEALNRLGNALKDDDEESKTPTRAGALLNALRESNVHDDNVAMSPTLKTGSKRTRDEANLAESDVDEEEGTPSQKRPRLN